MQPAYPQQVDSQADSVEACLVPAKYVRAKFLACWAALLVDLPACSEFDPVESAYFDQAWRVMAGWGAFDRESRAYPVDPTVFLLACPLVSLKVAQVFHLA